MVRGHDYPPNWAVLPGAEVTAELTTPNWAKRPVIEILGNRQGLLSLGNLLMWVCGAAADLETFSITGLSFVHARSSLSLIVVQSLDDQERAGRVVRVDKDQQFEWRVHQETLERMAIGLMCVAFYPYDEGGDHTHACRHADSDAELFFAATNMK